MTWHIYHGTGEPHGGIDELPVPPPWRAFGGGPPFHEQTLFKPPPMLDKRVATSYRPTAEIVEMVNVALVLRRPLLVTGPPGVGKSTLAFSVAHELCLGPVLYWPITSRSTIRDGLYQYDAVGRWQEANLRISADRTDPARPEVEIGHYIQLGPLGTALLPSDRPRVVLIDDLDQGDLDLPRDLLTIFEEGEFVIPELSRLNESEYVEVMTADRRQAPIGHGRVGCRAFPFVVITSGGEREFVPAFLRLCVQLDVPVPDATRLRTIVEASLGTDTDPVIDELVDRGVARGLTPSQLLNAIYLARVVRAAGEDWRVPVEALLSRIDAGSPDGW